MPVPEATATTGTFVLAADDSAALARFYGALLGVEPQLGLSHTHWRVPWPRQQGRLALCLQRRADGQGAAAVLERWISAALDLGASLHHPAHQEAFGVEAWLLDPEGNRLLLLVLPSP